MKRTAAVLALLGALPLPLLLVERADAFIYWAKGDGIGRANLDGTAANDDFLGFESHEHPLAPRGIGLDTEHVYWVTSQTVVTARHTVDEISAVGRANLDGTGVKPDLITGLPPAPVDDLAIDAGHAYWTTRIGLDPDSGPLTGAIGRAKLDGTGVERSFIEVIPGSVAVDAGHIYWTEANGIGRANLDGTGVDASFIEVIPDGFLYGAEYVDGVAVDASHVYWAERYCESGQYECANRIGRAKLDGTGVERSFLVGDPVAMYADRWDHVAVNGSHLYWTSDDRFGATSILRANIDGTGSTVLIPPISDAEGESHIADIAADALIDTKLSGRVSARRTQRQSGKRIAVEVTVRTKERLTAKASGQINPGYKLRPQLVEVESDASETLKLKPKRKAARRIARALRRGETPTAEVMVRLTDWAGNGKTEKLRVRLRRPG